MICLTLYVLLKRDLQATFKTVVFLLICHILSIALIDIIRKVVVVCILTRDESIKSLIVPVFINSKAIELLAIDVLNLDAPFHIVTVYRPPVSDSDSIVLHDIKVTIECLQQLPDVDSTVVINGDFNFPNINWIDPV